MLRPGVSLLATGATGKWGDTYTAEYIQKLSCHRHGRTPSFGLVRNTRPMPLAPTDRDMRFASPQIQGQPTLEGVSRRRGRDETPRVRATAHPLEFYIKDAFRAKQQDTAYSLSINHHKRRYPPAKEVDIPSGEGDTSAVWKRRIFSVHPTGVRQESAFKSIGKRPTRNISPSFMACAKITRKPWPPRCSSTATRLCCDRSKSRFRMSTPARH